MSKKLLISNARKLARGYPKDKNYDLLAIHVDHIKDVKMYNTFSTILDQHSEELDQVSMHDIEFISINQGLSFLKFQTKEHTCGCEKGEFKSFEIHFSKEIINMILTKFVKHKEILYGLGNIKIDY